MLAAAAGMLMRWGGCWRGCGARVLSCLPLPRVVAGSSRGARLATYRLYLLYLLYYTYRLNRDALRAAPRSHADTHPPRVPRPTAPPGRARCVSTSATWA